MVYQAMMNSELHLQELAHVAVTKIKILKIIFIECYTPTNAVSIR